MNEDSMSEKINYHMVVTQGLCDVINVRLNLIDFELGRDEKFENVFQFKITNWRQFLTNARNYGKLRLQHKITNKKKFTFMKYYKYIQIYIKIYITVNTYLHYIYILLYIIIYI